MAKYHSKKSNLQKSLDAARVSIRCAICHKTIEGKTVTSGHKIMGWCVGCCKGMMQPHQRTHRGDAGHGPDWQYKKVLREQM